MKSIRNIKIKTKLLLLGAISILGLVVIGAESVITAKKINDASTEISQTWIPAIIIAEKLNTITSDYRIKEYNHVISTDDEYKDLLEKEMKHIREEIRQEFSSYEFYITDESDRKQMEDAKGYWQKYLKCSEGLLTLSRANDTKRATELIIGQSQQLFDKSSNEFVKVVEFNRKGSEAASREGDHLYERLARLKILMVGLVGTVISLLVIYIIIAIDKPVKALVEGTRRAANGDLNVHLTYRSEDEIGILTRSVNELIDRLQSIIDDEKYLLREIGSENFKVKSNCEQAYRGDFAPILYSITSLMNRLNAVKDKKEGKALEKLAGEKELKDAIEKIDIKDIEDKAFEEAFKEMINHGSREMDASDKTR